MKKIAMPRTLAVVERERERERERELHFTKQKKIFNFNRIK